MAVNYFLSTVGSDVETFNNYATFRQATADNNSPIPGYLIEEVNAISYENNGSNCGAVINYFISRLQSQSPFVKIKVLKLLLVLVKNGHKNILEELKVHEVPLKHAQNFSGSLDNAQDAQFGNIVRKLAKELLNAVFSDEIIDSSQIQDMPKMTGLGSQSGVAKLSGFGNAAFSQKSFGERMTQHVADVVDKVLSPSKESASYKNQAKILSESLPCYNPISVLKDASQETYLDTVSSFTAQSAPRQVTKVHVAGKAGGGWDDDDEDETNINEVISKNSTDDSVLDSLENKSDLVLCVEYPEEHSLVDSFAVDSPLDTIKWSEVDCLCKKATSLSCEKICEFLVDNLSSSTEENVKLRSLVLMEYFLHHDIINCDSLLHIAMPKLLELESRPKSPIQIKSKKLGLIIKSLTGQLSPRTDIISTDPAEIKT